MLKVRVQLLVIFIHMLKGIEQLLVVTIHMLLVFIRLRKDFIALLVVVIMYTSLQLLDIFKA